MKQAIQVVRETYRGHALGHIEAPSRILLTFSKASNSSLILPAYVTWFGVFGVKIASVFPNNRHRGFPTVTSILALFSLDTGQALALMDGEYVTAIKTGAASAVATDLMAIKEASVLAVIGAGQQAPAQVQGICSVRPIEIVKVYDPFRERSQRLVESLPVLCAERVPTGYVADTSDEACDGADVIVTVTTSPTPVINASSLKRGVHINAVGSFRSDMQEIEDDVISMVDFIATDCIEDALQFAGDILGPISRGVIDANRIDASVGELVVGRKLARKSNSDVTLFESIGFAPLDVAVGAAIYKNALDRGLGQRVDAQ